jgi:hypothetical protein
MSLSITIDLSEADLAHFQEVVKRAQESAGTKSPKDITDAARQLLVEAEGKSVPEFISQRLCKLEALIEMVHDEGWGLSGEDKQRVLTALMYFADPKDVIPDSVPVVGLLDDAIMIELCVRELKHEVDAYEDFCSFRKNESAQRGLEASSLLRADWLEERRVELQERMRRRRTGSYAGGGGMSVFGVR